jgi:hypothetical protein
MYQDYYSLNIHIMKTTLEFALSCTLVSLIMCLWVIVTDERPKEYDYIIDLQQDHINVFTDDGRTLEIHPDSLQSFIEQDNL